MRNLSFLSLFAMLFLFQNCASDSSALGIERPHDPWVFRSVMDETPRMLTVALHDDLWAAYSAQNGALHKVWSGGVNFDGAVYTTHHGPQPSTLGNFWFRNAHIAKPFVVIKGGKDVLKRINYKGHEFKNGQVYIKYDLVLKNNKVINISERPEYATKEDGSTGFERTFITKNIPNDVTVKSNINVSSIALESSIETNGEYKKAAQIPREFDNFSGVDIDGTLVLNKGKTTFTTWFTKKPLIENPNKIAEAEEAELPLGYRLIARNSCKTCHNTYVKTVGPAYMEVAKKYRKTKENSAMLVNKVIKGGAGVWGSTPMQPHADLDPADIAVMIEYIMDLDAEEESKMAAVEKTELPKDLNYIGGIAAKDDEMLPGAKMYIHLFDFDLKELADLKKSKKPVYQGIVPTVHAQGGDFKGLEDNFAIISEGFINIPKDNNYTFRLVSDDGSRFILDGEEIINYDGLHGAGAKDGEVALKKGYHPFRVEYFQGKGGKYMSLQWKSFDDEAFEKVPATAFAHYKKDKFDKNTLPMAAKTRIPGDAFPLNAMHPSYTLTQARPNAFTPKVGGLDFFSDGRVVISTWDAEGAVYVLDNVEQGDPDKINVTKIASGLAEPLGLKVVNDVIYVLQKQELTKLVDNNGDGLIDEYQTFANGWRTSANFHEFAFGLEHHNGFFYATLATAIEPGGASTQPQIQDRGKVIRINDKTGNLDFMAHGLRTPNGVGLGVDNEIFVADNQGDWLPASKIMHITEGAFLGSRSVDPEGVKDMKPKQPVVWLPQDEIGNSPSTPLAINDGPYKGQMIHGEVTHGGVKRVFVEKVNGEYQGALFRFMQGLESGVNRLRWAPDGALFFGGVGSTGNWGHSGKLWYGLQRMMYNGASTFEMLAVRAKANGMEIEFTEALPEGMGWDASDYEVKQWWYEPTINYGGPKMDLEDLKVKSATVSKDRKRVFLEMDGMKKEHLVYIHIPNDWVSAEGHEIWSTECWYTLNNIPTETGGFQGTAPASQALNTLSESEKAAGWKLLFDGKSTKGWRNFKKETIGKSWIIKDDAIMLNATPTADGWKIADGGDIITDGEYENFEMTMEWKISACGNSGIFFNVTEDDKYDYVWQTGPEMQVLDNACHPDAKFPTHRAGDLYDMIECKYVVARPAGQWNQVRIIVNNGKAEHWLNGRKVVEYEMWNSTWDRMVKGSKFNGDYFKDFGKAKKGHIALQDHNDSRVWYRDIKIKEL